MQAAENKIVSGEWDVFDGKTEIEDNAGEMHTVEGADYGSINWYYRNVVPGWLRLPRFGRSVWLRPLKTNQNTQRAASNDRPFLKAVPKIRRPGGCGP